MAVNSKKQAAEAAETAEMTQGVDKNTPAAEKAENGANKAATEPQEEATYIYIGPKLPAGKLKSNAIFIGTRQAIKTELAAVLEEYPLVDRLIVPVEQLAEKKDKVRTAGNILNKYYSDIVSTIEANRAKEA